MHKRCIGTQALFRRAQLKALVDLHSESAGLGGTLSTDEINVIRGALDLTSKVAYRSMTPIDKVSRASGCFFFRHILSKGLLILLRSVWLQLGTFL